MDHNRADPLRLVIAIVIQLRDLGTVHGYFGGIQEKFANILKMAPLLVKNTSY